MPSDQVRNPTAGFSHRTILRVALAPDAMQFPAPRIQRTHERSSGHPARARGELVSDIPG